MPHPSHSHTPGALLRAWLTWNTERGDPGSGCSWPRCDQTPACWAPAPLWRSPARLPRQRLAQPQCPSPLPDLAAFLPVGSLITNQLSPGSALPGIRMPWCSPWIIVSHGVPRCHTVSRGPLPTGLHLCPWLCLVGAHPSTRVWGVSNKLPAEPRPPGPSERSSVKLPEFDHVPPAWGA